MPLDIAVGGRYSWRKQVVRVEAIEVGRVLIRFEAGSEQSVRLVRPTELEALPEDDELKGSRLNVIPLAEWEALTRRAKILDEIVKSKTGRSAAVKAAATTLELTERQVWRLLKIFEANPTTLALLGAKCGRPAGSRFLGQRREEIIRAAIEETYLRAEKPTVAALLEDVLARCVKAGEKVPSPRTLRRRIARLVARDVLKKREGAKAAGEICDGVPGSVEVAALLARIEIDHTLVDVILRADTPGRKVIGRPWLTLVIECKSRMVLGFYLSFEPPSAASVAMALAMAAVPKSDWLNAIGVTGTWPAHGIPREIWVDNALEFRSEALRRGCDQYLIKLCFRPVGAPRYGGMIERLIGTLMGAVHLLPGTTQSSVAELGDYDAEKRAVMTLSEFIPWFTEQVVTGYHLKPHRTLGIPPIKAWERDLPNCELKTPRDLQEYYATFLPGKSRRLTRTGVQIDTETFWSDQFSGQIASGAKVLVHYHRMDAGQVYVRLPDGQLCVAANTDASSKHKTFSDLKAQRQNKREISADPELLQQRAEGYLRNRERLEASIKKTATANRAPPTPSALPPPNPPATTPRVAPVSRATREMLVMEMD
jgi:putative transposase